TTTVAARTHGTALKRRGFRGWWAAGLGVAVMKGLEDANQWPASQGQVLFLPLRDPAGRLPGTVVSGFRRSVVGAIFLSEKPHFCCLCHKLVSLFKPIHLSSHILIVS